MKYSPRKVKVYRRLSCNGSIFRKEAFKTKNWKNGMKSGCMIAVITIDENEDVS